MAVYLFQKYWWLIFPFVGLGWGFLVFWFQHKREVAKLDLLKTYIAQGKEPPPSLMQELKVEPRPDERGVLKTWKRAINFGSLAAGFAGAYLVMTLMFHGSARAFHSFLVVAVIFAMLSIGAVIFGLIQRKHDAR